MKTSEDITQIAPSWVAALHQLENVTKDASGHHGKYATLGAVLATVKPVLEEHGLAVQQYAAEAEANSIVITTRVWHTSGQWMEDEGMRMPAPNDPQKVGGSVTYGRRYSLVTFFALSAEDDDGHSAAKAMQDERASARPKKAAAKVAAQSTLPDDAAQRLFSKLCSYAGKPVATSMKLWSEEAGKKLTAPAMRQDPAWMAEVQARLEDTVAALTE